MPIVRPASSVSSRESASAIPATSIGFEMRSLLEDLENDSPEVLEEGLLDEAKKKTAKSHHPFKRKATLGPGPRKGTNTKTNAWKCSCSAYVCKCKNKKTGKNKTVKIDPGYKKSYNKDYRTWRADKYK